MHIHQPSLCCERPRENGSSPALEDEAASFFSAVLRNDKTICLVSRVIQGHPEHQAAMPRHQVGTHIMLRHLVQTRPGQLFHQCEMEAFTRTSYVVFCSKLCVFSSMKPSLGSVFLTFLTSTSVGHWKPEPGPRKICSIC